MQNIEIKKTQGTFISDNDKVILRTRIVIFGLHSLHLVFMAFYLLPIDFSVSDDPRIKVYNNRKLKLITSWVNVSMLIYYPICLYCDCRQYCGQGGSDHVRTLNKLRHTAFSNLLYPATMFADTLFWRIWTRDRELISPPELDVYVPYWTYHSMHTVSLAVVLLDLALVPRTNPPSKMPGLKMMTAYITAYVTMFITSLLRGDSIYPLFENISCIRIISFIVLMYAENLLHFVLQWMFIDLWWGGRRKRTYM